MGNVIESHNPWTACNEIYRYILDFLKINGQIQILTKVQLQTINPFVGELITCESSEELFCLKLSYKKVVSGDKFRNSHIFF